ncbi:hypothetical protein [Actinoplanes sp. G11-F43]|uniref:hypothetical protein n=1 Tax=Actinoplanes sp. G11-F43 TaxID=3424130 RepID=UPI003D32D7E5
MTLPVFVLDPGAASQVADRYATLLARHRLRDAFAEVFGHPVTKTGATLVSGGCSSATLRPTSPRPGPPAPGSSP